MLSSAWKLSRESDALLLFKKKKKRNHVFAAIIVVAMAALPSSMLRLDLSFQTSFSPYLPTHHIYFNTFGSVKDIMCQLFWGHRELFRCVRGDRLNCWANTMAASQGANIDQTCKYSKKLMVLAEVKRFLHCCIGTEVMDPRPFLITAEMHKHAANAG